MNNDPEFLISVAGTPKTEYDLERFKRLSHVKILKINPDTKLDETNFARINYKFEWSGDIKNWSALTYAHRAILEYSDKYLDKWEYDIKINLKESGE